MMMIWILIPLALLIIVLLLLIARVRLRLSSIEQFICINYGRLVVAKITWNDSEIDFVFRIMGFRFKPSLLASKKSEVESEKKLEKQANRKRKFSPGKIGKLLNVTKKSVTIREIYANIDTGDFPLNAQLIPVLIPLNRKNITLQVNFFDVNEVNIDLRTRPIRLLWNYIIYSITIKN